MKKSSVFLAFCLILAVQSQALAMELKTPEFKNNGYIPKKFTYHNENVNPALMIYDIPSGAKSIALICDDPDAPGKTWVHWVAFNIPVTAKIEENSAPGKQGINDFGRNGYDGPCPPFGTHHYVFKIYALDTEFDLEEGASKADLERAMEGHILAKAELKGLYKK